MSFNVQVRYIQNAFITHILIMKHVLPPLLHQFLCVFLKFLQKVVGLWGGAMLLLQGFNPLADGRMRIGYLHHQGVGRQVCKIFPGQYFQGTDHGVTVP